VLYGATLGGVTVRDYLMALKDAGVGSLPGTSAEILVDAVRQQVSPGRIGTSYVKFKGAPAASPSLCRLALFTKKRPCFTASLHLVCGAAPAAPRS
jgi:hypothetical protein